MVLAAETFESNRGMLWGICYRMTGNAADADDLVQETFVRALERPPRRLDEPLRPWLVRVAINLSRDLLRRRRKRGYRGEWLPSPIPTDDLESPASYEPPAPASDSPLARYDMLESVSFAFLLALEALTPTQRAVLLLRDVFDYSTLETAEALGLAETNAKVNLHRARKKMRDYDDDRALVSIARREATRHVLEEFLHLLKSRNIEGLERLLSEDVISVSDGGGEVAAAIAPIRGRSRVLRLLMGLAAKSRTYTKYSFRTLNGLPAVIYKISDPRPGLAPLLTMACEIDGAGRIRRLNFVLAPSKLTALE